MQAFELRDVIKPHRPSPVALLELVATQYALCLIDAPEDTLLAFPTDRIRVLRSNEYLGRLGFTLGFVGPEPENTCPHSIRHHET
jgi:hypothetical protein